MNTDTKSTAELDAIAVKAAAKEYATGNRLPMGQKIAYGIGQLGNSMFPAALGVFMVVLVQGLGMPPVLWGIVFFLPRVWDAIIDPIMGFITDNYRSRWGRRKPFILFGAVMSGVSFVAMWQLHPENGVMYNFWYFTVLSLVFYTGLTIFGAPYVAMGYEMSTDFHERTRLMAVSQWIGQWAWVICPWFWVLIYDPKLFPAPDAAARSLALWVGLGCMVFALVPGLFVDSPSSLDDPSLKKLDRANFKENIGNLLQGFKDSFANKPFRKLCMATFLVFNTFNCIAAFSFFIIVHHMFHGDPGAAGKWPAWNGSIGALCTCFLVIPAITMLSRKIGKKNSFIISQAISIIGYGLFWWCFIPGKPALMFIPLPFFAFGIGGLFTLMMSMTADVCDLDELNTGARREGTFGAIYWWMVKFGLAFAGLFSGVVMNLVHFDANASVQAPGAITGIRIAYTVLPILGTLLAIAIMWNYDLSEEKSKEVRMKIEERRRLATAKA
ncbi:MAG: sugar (GPH):cation symporter [Fibrobacteres bacterium]|nr:sugar (GPH):cation symporter [Fibrobacterota bacterium]